VTIERRRRVAAPEWWPPKVGDRLRGVWGPDAVEDPLLHVVAVFQHAGEQLIVTAEWDPSRQRWHREIQGLSAAVVGLIRPDGSARK
jgi:hypothetical protein